MEIEEKRKQLHKNEIDMTTGPILRKMLIFAIPVVFSGLLQFFFNAADVMVVGRFAGDEALAAVGVSSSPTHLVVNVLIGMGTGVNVVVARAFGAGREKDISQAVHTSVLLSIIGGVIVAIIGLVFSEKLLISMFFVLGVIMANNTYFSYLYIEGGGDIGGVGLAFLLMAGSEAPFMWLVPKVNRFIPTEKLIVVGMVTAVIRFSFYSFLPSAGWLLGTFFLQGLLDGIILVEMVKYFGKVVEPRLSSLSVATLYSLGNSLSAIICNLMGGVAMDIAGIRLTYIFFAAVCAVSLTLYLAFGLHKED